MSLLAGIFNFDGQPADASLLERVLASYKDLGPDGSGVWARGPVSLGHLMRHSTPESKNEKLPLAMDDDRLAIITDARIDNREELFQQLGIERAHRRGMPDGELILNAWRRWGTECPERLEGDFSLAVYDQNKSELVLASSAFCFSPLYYIKTDRSVAFGSLIRPLLTLARVPKKLNELSFARFAACVPKGANDDGPHVEETMFQGVNKLPGATVMVLRQDGTRRTRVFWKPDPCRELRLSNDEEYYEGVRELMIRSVSDRMRSHHPVVCLVSGGLDSSSIACIAARRLRSEGKRLSVISSVLPKGHSGPERDERHFIDTVKQAEDLDVDYVYPAQSFIEDGSIYMNLLEQPYSNHKGYVYSAFFHAALRQRAGVILDGVGGEMGPTNHAHGLMAWLVRKGQWHTASTELRALAASTNESVFRMVLRHVIAPHLSGLQMRYHQIKNPAAAVGRLDLPLKDEFVRRHELTTRFLPNDPSLLPQTNPKERLAQTIGRVSRRSGGNMSLAHGIRTWFPMLDRRLLDFCLAVPARLYHVGGWKRNLVRRAMDGILPPEIQWRTSKEAFSPDFYQRFQNTWQAIRDEFAAIPTGDFVRNYYEIEPVIKMLDGLKGRPGNEISPEGFQVKLCVQSSLAGIRFLRWFNEVKVELNSGETRSLP